VEGTSTLDLGGRSLLLVSPRFFGYEMRIVAHIQGRGGAARWIDERPGTSALTRGLTRMSPAAMSPVAERYYHRVLRDLEGQRFTDILFVSPESCTARVIRRFRVQFPTARILLYMWDSFENKGRTSPPAFISLFDRAASFDPVDADRFGIQFRPLFYCNEAGGDRTSDSEFAFSFVGTIHSDRYRILRSLCRQAEEARLRYFFYPFLQSRLVYWLYRSTRREFLGTSQADFHFDPLPYPEVLRVLESSMAIIDIEHPRQRGLTMRTLEVLGSGKKLVTTNELVRDYPFFSSDRICIIDRNRPNLDRNFFQQPAPPVPSSFRSLYGLTGWMDAILNQSSSAINSVGP
jgi:hypothetical protein